LIPASRVRWEKSYRIIPTRFPTRDLFAPVSPPGDWGALEALADLTNPRLQQKETAYGMFPPEDCARGDGADLVMATFTHLNPSGSRFSDGTYGVYYAAHFLDGAISETVYHRQIFFRHSTLPAMDFDMQVIVARIEGHFHDLRKNLPDPRALDAGDYSASQKLALALRTQHHSQGIVYPSVRHAGATNVAVFLPKAISDCRKTMHLVYIWDGASIVRVDKRDVMRDLRHVPER
jgi:hypothetical protein